MGTSLYMCCVTGRAMVYQRIMGTSLYRCCVTGRAMGMSVHRCCVTGRAMGTSAHVGGTPHLQTSSLSENVPCRSTKLYSVVSGSVWMYVSVCLPVTVAQFNNITWSNECVCEVWVAENKYPVCIYWWDMYVYVDIYLAWNWKRRSSEKWCLASGKFAVWNSRTFDL